MVAKKKKLKKETLDSKLAEIDKASSVVALEAKIAHVDEIIEKKNTRLSMVTEDENLSELVDKTKIKAMQHEVKDLERRKMKMELKLQCRRFLMMNCQSVKLLFRLIILL